jgi:hypothetical protein
MDHRFNYKDLLLRIIRYFENVLDICINIQLKKEAPLYMTNALWRLFNGDPFSQRFYITFGTCPDDTYINGVFSAKSVIFSSTYLHY